MKSVNSRKKCATYQKIITQHSLWQQAVEAQRAFGFSNQISRLRSGKRGTKNAPLIFILIFFLRYFDIFYKVHAHAAFHPNASIVDI